MDQANDLPGTTIARGRPRGGLRVVLRRALYAALALVVVLGLAAGALYLRLATGPITFDGLSGRVSAALAERLGPGWTVGLRDSAVELDAEGSLALRAAGLDIRNPEGGTVVRAPLAVVSLDTWGLLAASFQPRAIEFRDLQVRAVINRDGSIAFAASDGAEPAVLKTLPSVEASRGRDSPVSTAVASILGVVFDPAGIVGSLDRARLTDARLTLVDEDGRERAVFRRVDGVFRRGSRADARAFEMRLDGPHGRWRFGADVRQMEAGRREGIITIDDLPVPDLLLLSGQSKLPLSTDLKLSARADVALSANRLSAMQASLHTSDGTFLIQAKDMNPVTVESVAAEARWDEGRRALDLSEISFQGAGNAVRLKGAWAQTPDGGWTLGLDGRNAVLRGATPTDAPVKIDAIEARLSARDGGVSIDRFALAGNQIEGTIQGTIGTAVDRGGVTLHVASSHGEGRAALRVWPENIAPPVRGYLVENARKGTLQSFDMTLAMSAEEFAAATAGEPMPDAALRIAFAVSDGEIAFSNDGPPLSQGRINGVVTGRATTIRDVLAEIRMPDGRALALTQGAFGVSVAKPGEPMAQVGLRLTGGVDALVSLMQTKLLRGLANIDLDPAGVKGQADLRIDFPLALAHVPEIADMPVTLSGTLADVGIDKVMGKERVEAGRFALAYDRAGFSMKGDAKLSGSPISVDLRQPKAGGPGELVVLATLDEALRARRGLPVAPQLAGPVSARVVVPLGRPGRSAVRVEADLSKASMEGLLPGWTKPAGRAGKAAFTVADTAAGGFEIRDLALDAGPTVLRGGAAISADGQLDRAEFSTLKISTGDDMRAQVERSGGTYRVSVKGAVADARPLLRSLSGPASSAKEPARDVDADISLAILTGHNDEALTNANIKASLRGRELRSLSLSGRLRSAPVAVQVAKADRGAPVLTAQSEDAGGVLRFLDIYRRMVGGHLVLQTALNDGPQAGGVQIRTFTLRNEPALARIMSQGDAGAAMPEDRVTPGARKDLRPDANEVGFDRLKAVFTRNAGRVDFRDAAISGPAMGFTLNGWVDTTRERTDVSGTFVPLYGLNNAFAQVPIVGLFLGGQNEGLFAINFRVAGALGSPNVSVNPLSAIAPGFLRKLFGAGGDDFTTGTAAPSMSDR